MTTSHSLDPVILFVIVGVVDHLTETGNLETQESLHSSLERHLGAGSPVARAF